MKLICGNYRRSEFVNEYINEHSEEKFLLMNCIDSTGYPFYRKDLLLFQSNNEEWEKDIKEVDSEIEKDIKIILFTNDSCGKLNDYQGKISSLKSRREVILVLKTISSCGVNPYIEDLNRWEKNYVR